MERIVRVGVGLGLAAVTGCGQSAPLYDKDDVVTWANTGSARAVWSNIDLPVAFTVGHTTFEDASCPAASDDGTGVTITGGCTDSGGKNWAGEVVVQRIDGARDLDLSFEGFGSSDDEVAGVTGSASVREVSGDVYAFDVDIVREGGGTTTEFHYAGTVSGDYGAPTLWNGTGTVTRSGLGRPTGSVEMRTDDARWDDTLCAGQAASGQTSIADGEHEVVVIYDGETDCDEEQAARWVVDGRDRGLLEGITCAVSSGGRGAGAGLAMGLLLIVGRRRRQSASERDPDRGSPIAENKE